MKKTTVVMCTYNGSRFLAEQLDSIRNQTQAPDEVIIVDDCSQDATCQIVDDFINRFCLLGWKLIRNKQNLGWKKNFFNACKFASGDYIFFSDQDDIWNLEKIECMSSIMTKYDAGCVASGFEYIDAAGVPIQKSKHQVNPTGLVHGIELSCVSLQQSFPGCCMCVSRDVAQVYIQLGFNDEAYDLVNSKIAIAFFSLYYVDQNLTKHRLHGNNATRKDLFSEIGRQNVDAWKNHIAEHCECLKRLYSNMLAIGESRGIIEDTIRFLRLRIMYLQGNASFFALLSHSGEYFSRIELVKDYAYKHNLNRFLGRIYSFLRRNIF